MSHFELQEFFVEGSNQTRSHVLLHVTEPSTPEERKKGYFFALAEINRGSTEQIQHLQQLIDDLESGYYESDDTSDKDAFEVSLEFVNRRGHHILDQTHSKVSCVVGVFKGTNLLVASHGEPEVKLFFGKPDGLDMMSLREEESNQSPPQLFPSVMQGELHIGDYLYIATPHVSDYISSDRIQKIIYGRRVKDAAMHVQKTLANLREEGSFGGVFLHVFDEKTMPKSGEPPKPLTPPSPHSLADFIAKQDKTQETLSPPFLLRLKKGIDLMREDNTTPPEHKKKPAVIAPKPETNYRPRPRPGASLGQAMLVGAGRALVTAVRTSLRWLHQTAIAGGKIMVGIFLLITNRGGQRGVVREALRGWVRNKNQEIGHLPMLTKILFLLISVFTVIFIGSLSYLRWQETQRAHEQAYLRSVEAVQNAIHEAEAARIYGDDTRAFTLTEQAKTALAELPENNKERQKTKQDLLAAVDTQIRTIRKLKTVEPTVVARLQEIRKDARADQLANIGRTLIAYGPNDSFLYTIDLDSQKTDSHDHATLANLHADTTPKEEDGVVFVSGDQSLALYDPQKTTVRPQTIELATKDSRIQAITVYNQRLYTLDPISNQIYRHQKTQTGYDKGSAWIKDPAVDIHDGVAVTIDGQIYVLKGNGAIIKLDAGLPVAFTVKQLDPVLESPTLLWTHNTVERLYVLEPKNKRVVVLTKDGTLVQQYTASEWENPTGMVINEAKRAAYVLDQNTVYEFSL